MFPSRVGEAHGRRADGSCLDDKAIRRACVVIGPSAAKKALVEPKRVETRALLVAAGAQCVGFLSGK